MTRLLRTPLVPVWVVLMIATGISWSLGADHGSGSRTVATAVVLAVAFVKVALIGLYFMELRHAPPWLRRIFHIWYLAAGSAVIGIFLSS